MHGRNPHRLFFALPARFRPPVGPFVARSRGPRRRDARARERERRAKDRRARRRVRYVFGSVALDVPRLSLWRARSQRLETPVSRKRNFARGQNRRALLAPADLAETRHLGSDSPDRRLGSADTPWRRCGARARPRVPRRHLRACLRVNTLGDERLGDPPGRRRGGAPLPPRRPASGQARRERALLASIAASAPGVPPALAALNEPVVTHRVYFDVGLCPSIVRADRALGSREVCARIPRIWAAW